MLLLLLYTGKRKRPCDDELMEYMRSTDVRITQQIDALLGVIGRIATAIEVQAERQ